MIIYRHQILDLHAIQKMQKKKGFSFSKTPNILQQNSESECIPCINYNIIIRINNQNNTAVINNNLLKSPRSLIAIQISNGQRKKFFEVYRQFEHAPSKRFASPAAEYGVQDITSFKESDGENKCDSTYTVHYHHKQLSTFFTVATGEKSRSLRCCGRADQMETTNTYVIL